MPPKGQPQTSFALQQPATPSVGPQRGQAAALHAARSSCASTRTSSTAAASVGAPLEELEELAPLPELELAPELDAPPLLDDELELEGEAASMPGRRPPSSADDSPASSSIRSRAAGPASVTTAPSVRNASPPQAATFRKKIPMATLR
jgi:hypothetical protein